MKVVDCAVQHPLVDLVLPVLGISFRGHSSNKKTVKNANEQICIVIKIDYLLTNKQKKNVVRE